MIKNLAVLIVNKKGSMIETHVLDCQGIQFDIEG